LCTATALLISTVIAVLFLSAFVRIDTSIYHCAALHRGDDDVLLRSVVVPS
jgi:hypothetical protein